MTLVCDPNLPSGERTFDRQFRTECIQPGGGANDPYYMGTSTNDEYNPPGYINHDITFFKNFAIGSRNLQFRAEMYNAFNLTQYQDVDTSAVFNYATGAADRRRLRPCHRRASEHEPHHSVGGEVQVLIADR